MSDKPLRILVVRQDRLGDAINAVPVLNAIRKKLPEAHISFMMARPFTGLFIGQPYLEEVIPWSNGLWPLIKALRQGRYNVLLMLHPSKRLAWAAFFAGIKQKAGLGFRPYYVLTGFRTSHLPNNQDTNHESQYNFSVARSLFELPEEVEPSKIFLSDQEISEARNVLMSMGVQTPIAILPANRGSSANWPQERWGELVQKLVEAKQEVLILGGPGEENILNQVKGGTSVSVAGPELTLRRLAAIFANCRQVVGSSTGTLHLAAAAGAKTMGLFCPAPASHPERWRPLGDRHVQLVPNEGYCQRCSPHAKCKLEGITVESVMQKISR